MNKLIQLIAITLLASSVFSICSNGCMTCTGGSTCTRCYKRDLLRNGQCGTKSYDHCLIFNGPGVGDCSWCDAISTVSDGLAQHRGNYKTAYALGYNTRRCLRRSDIDRNCVSATYKNGVTNCAICRNGYYPDSNGRCTKLAKNPQCKFAGINSDGSPRCFLCISGWVVNTKGTCSQPAPHGCLISNNSNTCTVACDAFDGYFMKRQGYCIYGAGVENDGEFHIEGTQKQKTDVANILEELYKSALENLKF